MLEDVVQGGGRGMGVIGIFQGKMMSGLTMIPPPPTPEMKFTGNPGIISDRLTSALGFIQLFLARTLLNYLTEETNMYAMYCRDVLKKKTMPSTGRGVVWGT